MQQSPDRDEFARLGRSIRNSLSAANAFINALLDSEAWARLGRRIFKRLLLIVIVGMVFAGVAWRFSTDIFQWLLIPAEGRLSPFDGMPVFLAPAEMFGVTVGLSFRVGILAAFPVLVVSIYTLFSQWLPPGWRTFIKIFVPSIFLAFTGGVAFVYYVILPTSLAYLLNFGEGVAVPLISVTNYFEMVLSLMFWVGVLFELPLAMYLLARLRLVSYRAFKWARLAVWFFAPILAAIITPSFDTLTWTMVMVPLILLYEAGLFLAWTAHPEDGNYFWLRSARRGISWLLRPVWFVVRLPGRAWRLVTRLFRR